MQAPKKKTSKSRRGTRRSHHALVPRKISSCSNCGSPKASYSICRECGYYNGKLVIKNLVQDRASA